MASDLIDDETLMPVMPMSTVYHWMSRIDRYWPTYNIAHQTLLDNGFTFDDPCRDDTGSLDNLRLKSLFDPGDPHGGSAWEYYYEGSGYFPRSDVLHIEQSVNELWGLGYGDLPIEQDWDTWIAMLGFPGALADYFQFTLGLCQRVCALYIQHRVAKMLENIYCLDNRGRPRVLL